MLKKFFAAALALAFAGIAGADTNSVASASGTKTNARPDYVLTAKDVVHVRVYQEDDLEAKVQISQDGSIVLPLLGSVTVGGQTREKAAIMIRDRLGEKYLVNPVVSLNIVEYSKRHFTVLGEVVRQGVFDMPGDESVNLLQAISMAGGYTRIGSSSRVTIQRGQGADKQMIKKDAGAMAKDKKGEVFEVLPDDVITIGEKIF